jgi:hypothetical protein
MPYLIMGPDHVSPRTFAGIFWVLCLAVFSCMTAGIVHDRVDGNARHWIHWSGVAVSAVAMLGLAMLLLLAI